MEKNNKPTIDDIKREIKKVETKLKINRNERVALFTERQGLVEQLINLHKQNKEFLEEIGYIEVCDCSELD